MERIVNIIVCITIIIALIILGSASYYNTSKYLAYRPPQRYIELTYNPDSLNCSRDDVRYDLNKLFNARLYKYKEQDLDDLCGRTNPFARVIVMDNNIHLYTYTFQLAHELVHLTHFTSNERYCNWIAFKTLYNTEKYRDVAIDYAIQDRNGGIPEEYSCWEYIVDYLILD